MVFNNCKCLNSEMRRPHSTIGSGIRWLQTTWRRFSSSFVTNHPVLLIEIALSSCRHRDLTSCAQTSSADCGLLQVVKVLLHGLPFQRLFWFRSFYYFSSFDLYFIFIFVYFLFRWWPVCQQQPDVEGFKGEPPIRDHLQRQEGLQRVGVWWYDGLVLFSLLFCLIYFASF